MSMTSSDKGYGDVLLHECHIHDVVKGGKSRCGRFLGGRTADEGGHEKNQAECRNRHSSNHELLLKKKLMRNPTRGRVALVWLVSSESYLHLAGVGESAA